MPNAIPYKYARCNEVLGVIVQKEPHAEVGVVDPCRSREKIRAGVAHPAAVFAISISQRLYGRQTE